MLYPTAFESFDLSGYDVVLSSSSAFAKGVITQPHTTHIGIAPVEANACGVPVVAFAAGGALDVQIEGETGCLFAEQSVDSLCAAIERAWSTH